MATFGTKRFWFQRHPGVTLTILAVAGCMLAIVAAEAVARIAVPHWAPARAERVTFWHYDSLLGWSHKPDQLSRFSHQDFSVAVSINSHGMRDREYPVDRTPGMKRMLVIGDSFGWGFGVEHDERFSELLEARHDDWEILNASVSGYGNDQQYLYLEHRGMAFDPDVVLLLFFENDFDNNSESEGPWFFKPMFTVEDGDLVLENVPVPGAVARQHFDRFVYGKTYIGPRLDHARNRLLNRLIPSRRTDWTEYWASREHRGGDFVHEVTQRLVERINDLVRNNESRFVLVSIAMPEERREFLRRISEDRGFPYLALDQHFDTLSYPVVFPNDEHWNQYGHQQAAAAIEAFLVQQGIFASPSARQRPGDIRAVNR